jgi:hypothetical protein
MKLKVTEQGVIIPKALLLDIEEVEIIEEENMILLKKVPPIDPILGLGSNPVPCGVTDGAENHDLYLSGNEE